jgi:hypothetical protein
VLPWFLIVLHQTHDGALLDFCLFLLVEIMGGNEPADLVQVATMLLQFK